jgi:phosphoribosylanthranilate isomerase
MVKVKICGITSRRDALTAAACGADALGFVFYKKSPRYVPPSAAAGIIRQLPPFVSAVGVFVDPSFKELAVVLKKCPLDYVQLHGAETPAFCRLVEQKLRIKVIKGLRIGTRADIPSIRKYNVAGILLDTCVPGQAGGTGQTFDWDVLKNAALDRDGLVLAGGLTAQNVGRAIRQVQPGCVDVSSGVERWPGRKDVRKIRAFVRAAKRALLSTEKEGCFRARAQR